MVVAWRAYCAFACLMLCAAALAAEPTLPGVNVTASRAERPLDETPATITTIEAPAIERALARDLRDLVRYEPNVDAPSDPTRFGASGLSIRGLSGNRVLLLVDGIRLPDAFNFGIGPFNTANRGLVDIDALKRVEIVRGPASSLYGSDALGGIVAFVTKDPRDFLRGRREPWYAAVKSSYASADRGWSHTGTLAGTTGSLDAMFVYTRRDGRERATRGRDDSIGAARTVANPQDFSSDNLLGKLVLRPAAGHQLRLTGEHFAFDSRIDLLSLNAATPTTTALSGDDTSRRTRLALDHEYRAAHARSPLASVRSTIYWQESETDSRSLEVRGRTSATCSGVTFGTSSCTLPRRFDFRQRTTGANVLAESRFATGALAHRMTYGIDALVTDTVSLRDALRIDTTLGTVSNVIAGDTFPARDFPASETRQLGAYVQDEIVFADARASLVPALRYDHYRLRVKPDPIYVANVPPGQAASDFSDSAWSPRLAGIWRFSDALHTYAQLSTGFRAPPYAELNAAFRNPIQSYVLIPNAELKSERSRGVEIGLRGERGPHRFAAAMFYNRYSDFIDTSVQLACPGDPRCVPGFLATFQSVNRADVRIRGVEANARLGLAPSLAALGAIGYADGDDLDRGRPLNSIAPLKAVAGLEYTTDRVGASLIATAVSRKRGVDETAGALARSAGFTVLDLTAYWKPTRRVTLTAGVFNLFDRKYALWADLARAGVAAASPSLDRFTQPGRNAALSVRLEL